MNDIILTAAGLPHRETRFPDPPPGTYAIHHDSVIANGADGYNCIFAHSCTIELYEPTPDDAAEADVEHELNAKGLPWTKQERYWLDSIKRYQTIYEYTHIEKRRI